MPELLNTIYRKATEPGLHRYLGLGVILISLSWIVLQLPLFLSLNNLTTDLLQGEIEARQEIIIVGIDDQSLAEVGAWPWDRSVFSKALNTITKDNPRVIGLDILFLESRKGDSQLEKSLYSTEVPIILGSKLVDSELLSSVFSKAKNGFVNFRTDVDGKIRRSQITQDIGGECHQSLAFKVFTLYLGVDPQTTECSKDLRVRNNFYSLEEDNSIAFTYSKHKFQTISFSKVLNEEFEAGLFKDKIVLIGSTALDLRSNLNDNFTDIFGRSIPGVEIHANIVNSFLEDSFVQNIDPTLVSTFILLISIILLYAYHIIRLDIADTGLFILIMISNIGFGFLIFSAGIIWPTLQISILLTIGFIYSLIYKYFTKTQENRYIKQAFGQYLSHNLLEQLLHQPERLKLGGETKEMTVLFSDIRSFTTMSEGMASEDLVSMLNEYLDYMANIILKHDGTIDKYIGDAIMAFWNAPLDDPDHATKALQTAMDMEVQVKEFAKSNPNYPEIKIGVGINTGTMTVGNLGGSARFDYTVLGDNVNLGSRLEGLTKKYGIVNMCSESTMEAYRGEDIIFRLLDEVRVKGKSTAVKIYEPLYKNDINMAKQKSYHQAFGLYQRGEFTEARKLLQKKSKNDKPSEKLFKRVEELIKTPPKHWNGVWNWEEK